MNIGSTANKILDPAAKHSGLLGAAFGAYHQYNAQGLGDSLYRLMNGQVHAPDMNEFAQYMLHDPIITQSLGVAVVGYFLKDISSNSQISKIGEIMQNGGVGFFAATTAGKLLYSMTHSDVSPIKAVAPQGSGFGTAATNPTAGAGYLSSNNQVVGY